MATREEKWIDRFLASQDEGFALLSHEDQVDRMLRAVGDSFQNGEIPSSVAADLERGIETYLASGTDKAARAPGQFKNIADTIEVKMRSVKPRSAAAATDPTAAIERNLMSIGAPPAVNMKAAGKSMRRQAEKQAKQFAALDRATRPSAKGPGMFSAPPKGMDIVDDPVQRMAARDAAATTIAESTARPVRPGMFNPFPTVSTRPSGGMFSPFPPGAPMKQAPDAFGNASSGVRDAPDAFGIGAKTGESAAEAANTGVRAALNEKPKSLLKRGGGFLFKNALPIIGLGLDAYVLKSAYDELSGRDDAREDAGYARGLRMARAQNSANIETQIAQRRLEDVVAKRAQLMQQQDPNLVNILSGLPEITPNEFIIGAKPNTNNLKAFIAADPNVQQEAFAGDF